VHGSGNLIQTLLRHNLVDQYRLWVFPLVIGSGKRLFSEGTIPSGLKLVDSKVSTTGVVMGTYEPAGEIVTGSFALDWPRSESLTEQYQYTARFGVFNRPKKRAIILKSYDDPVIAFARLQGPSSSCRTHISFYRWLRTRPRPGHPCE